MTPYALLIQACGISQREAAELHGVRLDTVKSWSSGRNRAPLAVLGELRDLESQIRAAATRAADEIKRVRAGRDGVIEIGYPADDHEARALGFPCVGAWRAMAGRLLAIEAIDTAKVRLVPRGSTPATAAAADAFTGRV